MWRAGLPGTERGLIEQGLGYFTYHLRAGRPDPLLDDGWVDAEPIVYEDFLPRSAAGIFQSDLSGAGTRDTGQDGEAYDVDRLAGAMDRPVHDPFELYEAQLAASLLALRLEPHPERTS